MSKHNLQILTLTKNVRFQKISILSPQKGLEFPGGWGGGFYEAPKFKEMYEARNVWNFQRGREVLEKNPFHGGGMDIFWNYTILFY